MPAMANDKAAPAFMDLPLEVRHTIFEYVAARDSKPKKLLRYWFEKKEAKALVEQEAINNPNGPAPRVVYGNDYDEYDDESAGADGEDGEDDEDGDADETENAEEDSEDEDGDENEAAEQEADSEGEDEAEIDSEGAEEESEGAMDGTQPPQLAAAQATAQVNLDNQPADEMEEDAGQVHTEEDDETEGAQATTEYEEDDGEAEGALAQTREEANNDSEGDNDEDIANGNGNTGTAVAATQPPPPAPVVRPHGKWRHIPNFMRLTQCPPPVQLLLTSQQLNNEAKNWFYDVATLRIDATGSFAHTSFFEEAFGQITDAAFSPMENIRKVDVTFVWDSTWIRADTTDCVEAIFPALLRQRSSFVYQILLQAPDLREVTIHWHDSAQDDESTNLMLDNLAPFHTLPATVKVIEHYIAADATPRKCSVAGKRRVEFQNILDMGLDRLF